MWGKVIRDAEIDGPYEVRNVLLRRDLPARGDYDPGPTILSAHHTRPYRASELSEAVDVEPDARGERTSRSPNRFTLALLRHKRYE